MEELVAEKESHARALQKLEQVKGTLDRKTATLTRLKEAQSIASQNPKSSVCTEDLEKKVQSLKAAMDKKDEALRQV
jgi:hypothetical protein